MGEATRAYSIDNPTPKRRGVLAVRVSTEGQGIDGDSPEAQIEQGKNYAPLHNIEIVEILTYLESASKVEQPMQNVINYAIEPKNNIDVVIVKSIDRFTRGGSTVYDLLKAQLKPFNVELEDIYGIINNSEINTLEHLGQSYDWSRFNPSRKAELLEAERAKDEMRDIMSRMIGAEIRYTQLGFWMRQPPYGFLSEKIDTQNGRRCLLRPDPTEAPFMQKMFELRAQSTMNDKEIAAELNRLGFRTRIELIRSKSDRTQIIKEKGGRLMTAKMVDYYTMKPIYAGINREKWTNDKPIKTKFDGLVSVDLFNKANHGKIVITFNEQGEPAITTRQPALHLTSKNVDNPEFAYRKYISCPNCYKTLLGSASKGKMGKYYAAYHCSNHGHYWREPNPKFEESITDFVERVSVSPERIEELMEAIRIVHEQQTVRVERDVVHVASRRVELETQIKVIVDKLKLISSPTAIKYMEEDLLKIEAQIVELDGSTQAMIKKEGSINMNAVLQGVKYYMEHLKELLLTTVDKNNKAAYFGVLFNMVPSYDKISNRTLKMADIPELNQVFQLVNNESENMVIPRRVELLLPG